MRVLAGGKDDSLNVKGAYLEVWADMLGSLGVIAAAVAIYLTSYNWIDPILAIGIGLWVLPRTSHQQKAATQKSPDAPSPNCSNPASRSTRLKRNRVEMRKVCTHVHRQFRSVI